jgi:hypothetical protein
MGYRALLCLPRRGRGVVPGSRSSAALSSAGTASRTTTLFRWREGLERGPEVCEITLVERTHVVTWRTEP